MTRVPITKELREELIRLKKETGVGETLLLRESPDIPHGLTAELIRNCLVGKQKSMKVEHFEWVTNAWNNVVKRISLTPDIKRKINAERHRTKVGSRGVLESARPIPDGLTYCTLDHFLGGQNKTIREDHLAIILKAYAALPNADPAIKTIRKRPDTHVSITDTIRKELLALQGQTQIKPARLLRGAPNRPKGINSGIINFWLSGEVKSANKDYLTYVLGLWRTRDETKPTEPSPVADEVLKDIDLIIPLTTDMRQAYMSEIERTGIKHTTLIRMLNAHGIDMKPNMLSSRLAGRVKSITKSEHAATLEVLKFLPSQ